MKSSCASVRIRLRSSEGWKANSKPASVFTAVIRAVMRAIFTRRFWRSVSSSVSKVSIASSAVISPRSICRTVWSSTSRARAILRPTRLRRRLLSSFRVVGSGRGRGAERRSGLKARAGVADGLGRGASAIMPAIDLVNLSALLDDAKCFALVRQHRWREGVRCPGCGSDAVIRNGCDDTQPHRQRYRCKACAGRFDDLTGTVLAGHHQPLRVWVLCLYLMGLNLSNRQIALELKLSPSDAQAMTEQLRRGLVARIPEARLAGEVEIDEVYVVAGHKGQPAAVAKRGARGGDAS